MSTLPETNNPRPNNVRPNNLSPNNLSPNNLRPSARPDVKARAPRAQRALGRSAIFLCAVGIGVTLASPAMAATKPATLQTIGKPTVTANCKGGSYRVATPGSPMTTISGQKWSSGISLTGTNCNTFFTWQLKGGYSTFKATVELDASDSGPLRLAFRSGNVPIKFNANGRTVTAVKVGAQGSVRIQVPVTGLRQLTIALPNGGSDAGILDVTSNSLS
jgi:hypothetical protein